jgi:hypothetical protein
VGTLNQNTLDFARYQQAAARTGGEITIDHPIGGHRQTRDGERPASRLTGGGYPTGN